MIASLLPITVTSDAVKTIFQGALGAATFGAYHQFQTNKQMELNNQLQEQKMAKMLEESEQKTAEMFRSMRRYW